MLGVLIGAVGAIFLAKTFRRLRYRRFGYGGPLGYGMAFGGGCGAGQGGPWSYGAGRHGYRSRYIDDDDGPPWEGSRDWARDHSGGFVLGALLSRIDATPEQARAIRAAFDELRSKARAVKDDARGLRKDLAGAMRSEILDVDTLGTIASRAGTSVDAVRDAAIGAILKVHDTLDARQREIVADALESRFGAFRRAW
jgi:uncharacterized membrane protein